MRRTIPLAPAFFHFVILNPLNPPRYPDHSTSTFRTTAPLGPTWQNRISSSNRALSPSARASTLPSGRFLTHPVIRSLLARSVISLLKKTPCTRPIMRILALASIRQRQSLEAFHSCFREAYGKTFRDTVRVSEEGQSGVQVQQEAVEAFPSKRHLAPGGAPLGLDQESPKISLGSWKGSMLLRRHNLVHASLELLLFLDMQHFDP